MKIPLPSRARDLVAPLGVAFTDGPNGTVVLSGLAVRAWPDGREDRTVSAVINGIGVACFCRLPGLNFDPADPFSGTKTNFVVEVRDTLGRFQPGRVTVAAPAKGAQRFPLYSAPGRAIPPGRIAFRAELWDALNNRPAAFARLTVKLAGNGGTVVAVGLSDADGLLLALGDWPAPKGSAAWTEKRDLALELRYDPAAPRDIARLDDVSAAGTAHAGAIWKSRGPNPADNVPYVPPQLEFDKPTTFRSDGDKFGRLFVTGS